MQIPAVRSRGCQFRVSSVTKKTTQKVSSDHHDYGHFIYVHSLRERDGFSKADIHRAVFENVLRDYLLTDRKLQRKQDLKLAQRKAEMRRKKRMKGRQQSIPCARLLHILCYLIVRKEGFGIQPRGSSLTVSSFSAPACVLRIEIQVRLHPPLTGAPEASSSSPRSPSCIHNPSTLTVLWGFFLPSPSGFICYPRFLWQFLNQRLIKSLFAGEVLSVLIFSPSRRGDFLRIRGSVTPQLTVPIPSHLLGRRLGGIAHLHLDSVHADQTSPRSPTREPHHHPLSSFFLPHGAGAKL